MLKSFFIRICPKRVIVSIVCMKKVYIIIVVKPFFVGLLTRIQESDDKGVCTRALWCLSKQNLDGVIVNTKVRIIIFSVSHVCSLTPSLLDLFMAIFFVTLKLLNLDKIFWCYCLNQKSMAKLL